MKATRFYALLALLMVGEMNLQAHESNMAQNAGERQIEYGYWADTVTEQPDGYVIDAYGNVEISTPEGLAWLSCVVNGLNGCEPDNFD